MCVGGGGAVSVRAMGGDMGSWQAKLGKGRVWKRGGWMV